MSIRPDDQQLETDAPGMVQAVSQRPMKLPSVSTK